MPKTIKAMSENWVNMRHDKHFADHTCTAVKMLLLSLGKRGVSVRAVTIFTAVLSELVTAKCTQKK